LLEDGAPVFSHRGRSFSPQSVPDETVPHCQPKKIYIRQGGAHLQLQVFFICFPQINFKFRICRARRCIENCFGLMAARWRVLLNRIEASASTADLIVKAICVLHNYLLDEAGPPSSSLVDNGLEEEPKNGLWRQVGEMNQALNIHKSSDRRAKEDAQDIRSALKKYFCGEGKVDWQEKMCLIQK
jgi:hypothetical protein